MEPIECEIPACSAPAQAEHSPCCSSKMARHGRALCCAHYCRTHWVEVNQCSPEAHAAAQRERADEQAARAAVTS